MAAEIQLTIDAEQVLRRLAGAPAAVQTAVRKHVAGGMLVLRGEILRGSQVKFRRGAAGLAGRLTSQVSADGPFGISAAIGFRKTAIFPYELSQEFGARAKGNGALPIPVSPEAKAASNRGVGPRDAFGERLFILRANGKAFLAEAVAGGRLGAKLVLHYVLKKSIPARLNFRRTIRQRAPDVLSRAIISGYREGVARA
jgi:hypothetical protein